MKICDAHNDFLTEIKTDKEKEEYIKFLKNNKSIRNVACVIWTSELITPLQTISEIKNNYLSKQNKKLILCIEDLGFINKNNFSFVINKLIEIKPFACGLVWNNDNNLGGGALGNSGLTSLGINVIKELEKNNIIIDTAHMNEKTFWEFCQITTKPIYNSHCNLSYFKNHKRNINNEQIKKIVLSKGFIGLSFVQTFISNNLIDSNIIAKQLAYFVRNYGDEYIGIGSDFYGAKNLPIDLKTYSQFNNLKSALKKAGLQNKSINKILYNNFNKFMKSIK